MLFYRASSETESAELEPAALHFTHSAVEDKDPHVTFMATCFYFLKLAVS